MQKSELNGKRILVTFLMYLGDLLLTTPFIYALRQNCPDSHITMLVDEKLKDVVAHNPYLDAVITIDKKGRDDSKLALVRFAQKLSAQNFDAVINLHPNERCSFIVALTTTKQRLGAAHGLLKWRWDSYTPLNRHIHAVDMYLDVLKQLGMTQLVNNGLEFFTDAEADAQASEFWRAHSVNEQDKLIGFNIGSAVVTKRWAPERFAQVAEALAAEGYKIVFFGGSMDAQMVAEATQYMKSNPIVATGEFSLGALAAAMRRCELIITNDSGPMHVAISQRVPIVALYGPSHVELYGPYTKHATVVTAEPPCLGCAERMKHQCADLQCMTRLQPEQVLRAAKKMLKQ